MSPAKKLEAVKVSPGRTSPPLEASPTLTPPTLSTQQLAQMAHLYPKPSLGYVRLIDGLFLGDIHASSDINFLVLNKVTHLVNCAGKEMPNKDFTELSQD